MPGCFLRSAPMLGPALETPRSCASLLAIMVMTPARAPSCPPARFLARAVANAAAHNTLAAWQELLMLPGPDAGDVSASCWTAIVRPCGNGKSCPPPGRGNLENCPVLVPPFGKAACSFLLQLKLRPSQALHACRAPQPCIVACLPAHSWQGGKDKLLCKTVRSRAKQGVLVLREVGVGVKARTQRHCRPRDELELRNAVHAMNGRRAPVACNVGLTGATEASRL